MHSGRFSPLVFSEMFLFVVFVKHLTTVPHSIIKLDITFHLAAVSPQHPNSSAAEISLSDMMTYSGATTCHLLAHLPLGVSQPLIVATDI